MKEIVLVVPKRLIDVLELDEFAKICTSIPKNKQIDNNNILQADNYFYILRNNVFYSREELKQLELEFQEILENITIPNEISLNEKIIKMSNIFYNNQHKLNQKPVYNPITFKTMLKMADKDLIGFFDELYMGTNPHTKSNKTNENNRKKLVSLCYFWLVLIIDYN
ncbi:hypothetical protein GLOIN_2v1846234 [Rhizophagus clarus]|uniref:Uncharacterized protein n=1 Tax=Rhizophagus clarus TaxID=94130 RepID=A0A8H3LF87_9GLOM|nr:hypothetical protein GLOIN_2v1846234 [Rhizophagus clarus]